MVENRGMWVIFGGYFSFAIILGVMGVMGLFDPPPPPPSYPPQSPLI